MKPTLLLTALVLLFSSCTEYQYLTVSGVNITKSDKHEFISENDTLKVQYNFTDYKGKVGVSIFNKLNEPLEIDWRKSAVIIDNKAVSYYTPNETFAGKLERDSLLQNAFNPSYLADMKGTIYINEPSQFIPPNSFIYKVPLALPIKALQNLPDQEASKESFKLNDIDFVSYKKMTFEKDRSPVIFRSYLTFRIGKGTAQKEFSVEHRFYVSEIWETTTNPQDFPEKITERGDIFYLNP